MGVEWFDKIHPLKVIEAVERGERPVRSTPDADDQRRHHYVGVVHDHGDNISRASEETGISRSTFQRNIYPRWLREAVRRNRAGA